MVLIIENDPAEAFLVQVTLERQGTLPDGTAIACITAADGAAVGRVIVAATPGAITVVVLDRVLDNEDGLTFVPLLKQSPALGQHAVVIVYSAHDEQDTVNAARAAGVDAFVSKQCPLPVGSTLLAVVGELWAADKRHEARPWVVLTRTGKLSKAMQSRYTSINES